MALAEFHIGAPASSGHVRVQVNQFTAVEFSPEEQERLLKSFARSRGYSLLDPQQRDALATLADEASGMPTKAYGGMADAVIDVARVLKALADTVHHVLAEEA